MQMKEMKEMQVEMCLKCRIGVGVLSRFTNICEIMEREEDLKWKLKTINNKFADKNNVNRINKLYKCFYSKLPESRVEKDNISLKRIKKMHQELQRIKKDEELLFEKMVNKSDSRAIEEIADILKLEGTIFEKYRLLNEASKINRDYNGNADPCLEGLHPVLCAARAIIDERRRTIISDNKKMVLTCMHKLNIESVKAYNKKLGEDTLMNLTRRAVEKIEENYEDKAEMEKGIIYIYEKYMKSEHNYEVNQKGQCAGKIFLKIVDQINCGNKPITDKFYKRISGLCVDSRTIMENYMQNAPKKFGDSLRRVMEMQRMSDTDVAKLIDVKMRSGDIKALKDTEKPTLPEENITKICRALLVSEDVLYKGVGKIYGNWMNLLDDEGKRIVKEKAGEMDIRIKVMNKSDDKGKRIAEEKAEEMNVPIKVMNKSDDEGKKIVEKKAGEKDIQIKLMNKTEIKNFIRSKIKNFIEMNDEDFQGLIEEHPDLFQETECCLYEDDECFDSLLNQAEAYALLEVLEKLERSELIDENSENTD